MTGFAAIRICRCSLICRHLLTPSLQFNLPTFSAFSSGLAPHRNIPCCRCMGGSGSRRTFLYNLCYVTSFFAYLALTVVLTPALALPSSIHYEVSQGTSLAQERSTFPKPIQVGVDLFSEDWDRQFAENQAGYPRSGASSLSIAVTCSRITCPADDFPSAQHVYEQTAVEVLLRSFEQVLRNTLRYLWGRLVGATTTAPTTRWSSLFATLMGRLASSKELPVAIPSWTQTQQFLRERSGEAKARVAVACIATCSQSSAQAPAGQRCQQRQATTGTASSSPTIRVGSTGEATVGHAPSTFRGRDANISARRGGDLGGKQWETAYQAATCTHLYGGGVSKKSPGTTFGQSRTPTCLGGVSSEYSTCSENAGQGVRYQDDCFAGQGEGSRGTLEEGLRQHCGAICRDRRSCGRGCRGARPADASTGSRGLGSHEAEHRGHYQQTPAYRGQDGRARHATPERAQAAKGRTERGQRGCGGRHQRRFAFVPWLGRPAAFSVLGAWTIRPDGSPCATAPPFGFELDSYLFRRHSIAACEDFVSPFQASLLARNLALEVEVQAPAYSFTRPGLGLQGSRTGGTLVERLPLQLACPPHESLLMQPPVQQAPFEHHHPSSAFSANFSGASAHGQTGLVEPGVGMEKAELTDRCGSPGAQKAMGSPSSPSFLRRPARPFRPTCNSGFRPRTSSTCHRLQIMCSSPAALLGIRSAPLFNLWAHI